MNVFIHLILRKNVDGKRKKLKGYFTFVQLENPVASSWFLDISVSLYIHIFSL